jgi:hypothetical protein
MLFVLRYFFIAWFSKLSILVLLLNSVLFFPFFGGTGVWTQGLALDRQATTTSVTPPTLSLILFKILLAEAFQTELIIIIPIPTLEFEFCLLLLTQPQKEISCLTWKLTCFLVSNILFIPLSIHYNITYCAVLYKIMQCFVRYSV